MSCLKYTRDCIEKLRDIDEGGYEASLSLLIPISVSLACIADDLEKIYELIKKYGRK